MQLRRVFALRHAGLALPRPSLPPPLLPALEQVGGGAAGGDSDSSGDAGDSKASRMEKKTRKALLKLGLKPVTQVSKVTVKKSKQVRA